ncbi:MAG: hypothetical protein ABIE03_03535 [Patescibacteria group bacterium]|nr:hypothetical protein [Patescibacteria group bacterium]
MKTNNLKQLTTIFSFLVILALIPILGFVFSSFGGVNATNDDLYDQLEQLEKELAEIKQQKIDLDSKISAEKQLQNSLASQIYVLENSIAELKLDIKEKEIDIKKMETEIKILEEEITEARLLMEGIEGDVTELQLVANDIISTIYIDEKTNTLIDKLLTADKSEDFLSQIQYHTALGAYDQNALANLITQKTVLEEEKQKLEDDKLEVEKLAEQITKQKELLEKDKEQLASQASQKSQMLQDSQVAAAYYGDQYANLSDAEKKKEAELDYILQQIVNSATKPKGYVVKGQVIATEGNNGCSTGPHTHFGFAIGRDNWVNPCSYLPYEQFNWGICSGSGAIRYPYDNPFYSSRGYTWYHQALDLIAGPSKYVKASHKGYYFEETPSCSNSWCSVGCTGPINPCIKVCEDVNCQTGKISIYCHVNFL